MSSQERNLEEKSRGEAATWKIKRGQSCPHAHTPCLCAALSGLTPPSLPARGLASRRAWALSQAEPRLHTTRGPSRQPREAKFNFHKTRPHPRAGSHPLGLEEKGACWWDKVKASPPGPPAARHPGPAFLMAPRGATAQRHLGSTGVATPRVSSARLLPSQAPRALSSRGGTSRPEAGPLRPRGAARPGRGAAGLLGDCGSCQGSFARGSSPLDLLCP